MTTYPVPDETEPSGGDGGHMPSLHRAYQEKTGLSSGGTPSEAPTEEFPCELTPSGVSLDGSAVHYCVQQSRRSFTLQIRFLFIPLIKEYNVINLSYLTKHYKNI
jgi:hypothetical protein